MVSTHCASLPIFCWQIIGVPSLCMLSSCCMRGQLLQDFITFLTFNLSHLSVIVILCIFEALVHLLHCELPSSIPQTSWKC